MTSRVSSKGQITLPVRVREKLGLVTGTPVQFEFKAGGVLLRKGGAGPHPVDAVFGRLELAQPVDTLLDAMRGPRASAGGRSGRRTRAPRR